MTSTSVHLPPLPPLEHPLEEGWTLPASWYSDGRRGARARADLRPHLAVRRPGGAGRRAGLLHGDAGRARPDRRHARPARVCCAASSTSAATAPTRSRRGAAAARRCSAPTTPGRTSSTARCGRRHARSARPASTAPTSRCSRSPSTRGGRSSSSTPDPEAAPLAETLGELPAIVAASGLDLSTLRFHSHHEWPIEANWKVALENYLECYHCPTAHPGLQQGDRRRPRLVRAQRVADVLEPDRAGARRPRSPATAASRTSRSARSTHSQYHFLWPNTTVNIAPGPANVSLERWVPGRDRPHDRGDRLLVRCRRAAGDRGGGARLRRRRSGGRTPISSSPCRRASTRARCRRAGSCARASS